MHEPPNKQLAWSLREIAGRMEEQGSQLWKDAISLRLRADQLYPLEQPRLVIGQCEHGPDCEHHGVHIHCAACDFPASLKPCVPKS